MSLLKVEPKDTDKWRAVWEAVDMGPDGVIKVYKLTKTGLDRLYNSAEAKDLWALRGELNELLDILRPVLVAGLKVKLLKVLEGKAHRVGTLLRRVPHGEFYKYSFAVDALHELVAERKAVMANGGWRKK